MTRVALYARYSSDNQRDASIEDQFRICREHAKREKWKVIDAYKDAGISGASMILRPGIQTLLQDAQAGRFDIVLAEALDRISRDQADVATLFKHLKFAGVPIVTLAEGEISELHVGLKGTMNALFLKDLAAKTHRGLRGRVEDGKSGGGLCYGYRVVRQFDTKGEQIRGDREIDAHQAEIIRRIFRDFAAGIGPRAIAKTLNDQGIGGPEGKLWSDTTIRGHVKRGTGIINNELYIGRLVWNRQRYVKDPSTGKRVSRLNSESEWVVTEVPDLRIVDDALWQATKARQSVIAEKYVNVTEAVRAHHKRNRLNGTRRPKSLLSGLLFCGLCGGPYTLRGSDRFACSGHVTNGSCTNSRTIPPRPRTPRALRSQGPDDGAGDRCRGDARLCRGDQPSESRASVQRRCLADGTGEDRETDPGHHRSHQGGHVPSLHESRDGHARNAQGGTGVTAGRRSRRCAGPAAECLHHLRPQGRPPDRCPQPSRGTAGSRRGAAGSDREGRADAWPKPGRDRRHAVWGTGHDPELDRTASHWKG
ncbi:recombinase family protein [Komagataeibacter europaeus]|uniref:recombinase family protein n=1 Tax=Komagataeibacter europaeus TaxID=33995 RepID=UPI001EFA0407|nr:recombinase family protein [Komagataeibacter europaeus]